MAFAKILNNHSGFTAPAEEFIIDLVRGHGFYGFPLTPDDVDVNEFRQAFEEMIKVSRQITNQYPGLILGDNCGRPHDQLRKFKAITTRNDAGLQALEYLSARPGSDSAISSAGSL